MFLSALIAAGIFSVASEEIRSGTYELLRFSVTNEYRRIGFYETINKNLELTRGRDDWSRESH